VYGFLSHLHSLMVTMSQKSSVPQAAISVSQALMSDSPEQHHRHTQPTNVSPALLLGPLGIAQESIGGSCEEPVK
jgi:hypothetical protein